MLIFRLASDFPELSDEIVRVYMPSEFADAGLIPDMKKNTTESKRQEG